MMKKTISAVMILQALALFAFGNDTLGAKTNALPPPSSALTDSADAPAGNSNIRTVVMIPVEGTVDYGMAAFIGRGIREAYEHDGAMVVLDINTYGGQVDAAFAIVDSIIDCKLPTAAFVRSNAISAGALIALSANQMVMRANTTIGDVAPIINSNEGPKVLGEKMQSPLRAKFRMLANKNGYPQNLAEAMVTEELAIFEVTLPDTVMYLDSIKLTELEEGIKKRVTSTRQIVRSNELLTMTNEEARAYGFSKMTVESVEEMLRLMGHADAEVVVFGRNWSERFVSIIAMLAPILMMLGISAIYIEMRSPGFGIPGAIGVVCLALVFFGQYMVGLANYTELLLLMVGGMLLVVEVFVLPGFGIAGVSGLVLILIGLVLSFQPFTLPSPEFPWQAGILKANILRVSLSVIGSIALIFLFFKYGLERVSKVIKGPYLAQTLAGAVSDEGMSFVPKVGDRGVAATPLHPAGKVRIGTGGEDGAAEVCDVVTDGGFIDAGAEVTVTMIQGNRIVVAAV